MIVIVWPKGHTDGVREKLGEATRGGHEVSRLSCGQVAGR